MDCFPRRPLLHVSLALGLAIPWAGCAGCSTAHQEPDVIQGCGLADWASFCDRCALACDVPCHNGEDCVMVTIAIEGPDEPCTLCGDGVETVACETAFSCLERHPDAFFWEVYQGGAGGAGGSGGSSQSGGAGGH